MKKNLFFFLLISVCISVAAQQQPRKPEYRPDWVYNAPHPENSTYLYVVEHGNGTTEREARNQAIARVFQSTANRIGQFVSTDEINRAVQAGTDYDVIGRTMKVPVNKVCEFSKQDPKDYSWTVYILCQVAKAGNITPEFEKCDFCNVHTIFDENMQSYNQRLKYYEKQLDIKNKIKEYQARQQMISSVFYCFGGLCLLAGVGCQLGWISEDLHGMAYAGFGMIGGGTILLTIPSLVNVSFERKEKKLKNMYDLANFDNNYLQNKEVEKFQLSIGFVPNGMGVTCTF